MDQNNTNLHASGLYSFIPSLNNMLVGGLAKLNCP